MRRGSLCIAIGLMLWGLGGCATYQDHLNRGQRYYDENEYEQALAIWRALEVGMDSFSDNEQARYAYLRGMTDYRLGYRPYARHWLAVSLSIEKQYPGGLKPEWVGRANQALDDLNQDVFGAQQQSATLPAQSSASDPNASGANAQAPQGPKLCKVDADCPSDQACLGGRCTTP